MEGYSSWTLFGAITPIVALSLYRLARSWKLDHIPSVGPSGLLGSYWTAVRAHRSYLEVVQEGYDKYKGGPFKIPKFTHWVVILNRHQLKDAIKLPEDVVSSGEATRVNLKFDYVLGRELHDHPYHIVLLRSQLTRHLSTTYVEVVDEMTSAFDETLALKDNEWKGVTASECVKQIVCRSVNRFLIGLPLCRDQEWLDFCGYSAYDVVKELVLLRSCPMFMLPLVSKLVVNLDKRTERGAGFLRSLIEERHKHMKEFGNDWTDKPNDFLQWCMDFGEDSVKELTQGLVAMNFAANHTTSNLFTQALQILATNPQYIEPLREEVQAVVEEFGWSRKALAKMRRVDSFLKETQRFEGQVFTVVFRIVMKDITLSDGTFIPKGTQITGPARAIHHDEEVYQNPEVFDPMRFVDLRSENPHESSKYQMTSTNPEYLSFGLGESACPGRFFAATLSKSMLAHVVTSYDLKLEENTLPPKCIPLGNDNLADPTAKIMFRKRAD